MGSFTTPGGVTTQAAPPSVTPADTIVTETAFGQAPTAGAAVTYSRGDHTHGTPASPGGSVPSDTVVTEQTFGQATTAGASATYSRGDHTHGTPPLTPAASVVTETAFGQGSAVGVSANYARQDHTHGTPPDPASSGFIQRHALPAPYVNNWTNEPNVDDQNSSTYAYVQHTPSGTFTDIIAYDLGSEKHIIIGADIQVSVAITGVQSGYTRLYLEYSHNGTNWYQIHGMAAGGYVENYILQGVNGSTRGFLQMVIFARYFRFRSVQVTGSTNTYTSYIFEVSLLY